MTVRTQSLLGIVPVFVALGFAVAGLVCFFELRETRWALHEEATSYAISVAQLTEPDDLRAMLDGRETSDTVPDVVRATGRIAAQGRIRRLSISDPSNSRLAIDVGSAAGGAFEAIGSRPVEMNGALVTVGKTADSTRIAVATAQIADQGAEWVGTVRAEVEASAIDDCLICCRGRLLSYSAIGMFVGVACALLAANLVLKPLRKLDRAAERAAAGDLEEAQVSGQGRIRELHDLANAFNTLLSMLKGLAARTRRIVYGGDELFEPRPDGRDVCDTRLWGSGTREIAGLRLDLTTVGGESGAFAAFVATRRFSGALIGCMAPAHTFDAPLEASACTACLNGQLDSRDPAEAFAETVALFGPQDLRLVICEDGGIVRSYHFLSRTSSVRTHTVTIGEGEVRAYHNLGAQADRRIQAYAAQFCAGSTERTAEEILSVACVGDVAPRGALLVVSRARVSRTHANRITLNSGEYPV